LKRKQEGKRKTEEKEGIRGRSLETRAETTSTMTISMAEEAIASQQVTTGPALMEGVERTNTVVVRGSEQGAEVPSRRDLYVTEIDRGRNCYACGGFGYIAHHCRNWEQRGRVAENRRLEYGRERIEGIYEQLDNLTGVENLESLD